MCIQCTKDFTYNYEFYVWGNYSLCFSIVLTLENMSSHHNIVYFTSVHFVVCLQMQKEREAYEVIIEGGRLIYKKGQNLVHTVEGSKWIFVLSSSRILYVGEKKKGHFQHSSFLAGGATIASGRLVAQNGVLDVCHTCFNYTTYIHNIDYF